MPTPSDLSIDRRHIFGPRIGSRRFPNRLGERHKIVNAVWRRVKLTVVTHQLPTARGGQATGVLLA
jgi:hypothetical protein